MSSKWLLVQESMNLLSFLLCMNQLLGFMINRFISSTREISGSSNNHARWKSFQGFYVPVQSIMSQTSVNNYHSLEIEM